MWYLASQLTLALKRILFTLENSDCLEAKQAIEYYIKEVKREIGALTALMAGLDVLVFTGGIGENSVMIRARVLRDMSWVGIELDEESNLAGETIISDDHSRVLCLKLHTDEERVIARHTLELAKQEMALN